VTTKNRRGVCKEPWGAITLKVLKLYDRDPYRTLESIAEQVGTSRQLVFQALTRWRTKEYGRRRPRV